MSSAIVPVPRVSVSVRPATMSDLAFIDALQKKHTKMVGWMPTQQLEGKIKVGHIIVAEDEAKRPLGYCIGNDQYFKRDDVGIIYQLNVVPEHRRSLVGATLVKAMFDRAAYGCKLFCCYCAQDIEANLFWESLGFVPLAFRTGSRGKGRTHIFWERRIREGDCVTPYWFPSQTSSGAIREDRLVLPIPPGTSWRDVMPVILPGGEKQLEEQTPAKPQSRKRTLPTPQDRHPAMPHRMQFGPPPPKGASEAVTVTATMGKQPKPKKPKLKNDPKHIAAARELRDRWLEKVSEDPSLLLPSGKYEVSRALSGPVDSTTLIAADQPEVKLLEAA